MRDSWVALLVFLALGAGLWRCPGAGPAECSVRAREPRRMSVRELRTLPGLGERLARAVAEERARRGSAPFLWQDVPGLGPVRVAALRARMLELGHPPEPFEQGAARYPAAPVESRSFVLTVLAALAGCSPAARETPAPSAARTPTPSVEPRHEVHRLACAEVHVRALGEGPAGVLFLHGARYSADDWLALGALEPVARRGLRALALDWPGSGASPGATPIPEPGLLLAQLLDALELTQVVLVAPSRGGAQAFALLARGEARVVGLLALAPSGGEGFTPASTSPARLRLVWGTGDEVVPRAAGEALAARLPGVRFEEVHEAGHAWYLGAPERFHALLGGFLDELGWPAR